MGGEEIVRPSLYPRFHCGQVPTPDHAFVSGEGEWDPLRTRPAPSRTRLRLGRQGDRGGRPLGSGRAGWGKGRCGAGVEARGRVGRDGPGVACESRLRRATRQRRRLASLPFPGFGGLCSLLLSLWLSLFLSLSVPLFLSLCVSPFALLLRVRLWLPCCCVSQPQRTPSPRCASPWQERRAVRQRHHHGRMLERGRRMSRINSRQVHGRWGFISANGRPLTG